MILGASLIRRRDDVADLAGRYLVVVDGADSWFRSGDHVEVTTKGDTVRFTGPPWTSNRSGVPVSVELSAFDARLFVTRHLRRSP